jgi:hypothetical protein
MGLVLLLFWCSVALWDAEAGIYSRLVGFNSRLSGREFPIRALRELAAKGLIFFHFSRRNGASAGQIEKIPGSTGKTGNSAPLAGHALTGRLQPADIEPEDHREDGETQRLWRAPASETAHIRPAASKDMPSMPPGTA